MKRILAIDTETTGLNVWTGARPFAVSMCFDDGSTKYWEWTVNPMTRKPRVNLADLREIKAIVRDSQLKSKTFFNARFDILMLEAVGVNIRGRIDEVSWMARAVDNGEYGYALKPLSEKYVDFPKDDQAALQRAVIKARRVAKKLGWKIATKESHGSKPSYADYWLPETLWRLEPELAEEKEIPRGLCEIYAVQDAERTILLDAFYRMGMDELNVLDVYEMEMRLWYVTMAMEKRGVVVDEKRMEIARQDAHVKQAASTAIVLEAVGDPDFNMRSSPQLANFLFKPKNAGGLGLPITARTKTGQPKTDAETLEKHKDHPIVMQIFAAKANKLALTNFFDKYPTLAVRDDDGLLVLHPGYRQWGTKTGRYSCSEPNIHSISNPATTSSKMAEHVVDIRQIFIPRPGHVWYCPDYAQLEVIIFACISGERSLIDAIKRGDDIHSATTDRIWGGHGNPRAIEAAKLLLKCDDDEAIDALDRFEWSIVALENSTPMKIFRKRAKAVTFTKIFGGGAAAVMKSLGVPHAEAVAVLHVYDDAFPSMASKIIEISVRGKREGFITNSWGRRLEVDPWKAYTAVNHWVQSDAADLMKHGMLKCAEYLTRNRIDAQIVMTIHDELVFEFRKGANTKKVLKKLCWLMADHGDIYEVATPVDIDRVDVRWSEKRKITL